MQQEVYVTPKRLTGQGSLKCIPQLKRLASALAEKHQGHVALFVTAYDNVNAELCETFHCPFGHHRAASQPTFCVTKPSKPVWCTHCHKCFNGLRWQCSCNRSWASCPLHYNKLPVKLGKKRQKPSMRTDTLEESVRKRRKLEAKLGSTTPFLNRLAFS